MAHKHPSTSEADLSQIDPTDVTSVSLRTSGTTPNTREGKVEFCPANALELDNSKAGMAQVDKSAVEHVINSVSRGSSFYINEQRKLHSRSERVSQYRKKWESYDTLSIFKRRAIQQEVDAWETQELAIRPQGQYLHFDMDMFFAAVEAKHNPTLQHVPFGVGDSSMLSTTNYIARKFGVRAGMPGFIGQKLCPNLVIVPCHFDLYKAEAAVVREIAVSYDPHFTAFGLDELTLEITPYLREHEEETPWGVAAAVRHRILEATQLSASCGIACTATLAKIMSNEKKPNGQCELPARRAEEVQAFVSRLPVRCIPGIGKAQEFILHAFHIVTCGDLYDHRYRLAHCIAGKTARFLLAAALGTVRGIGEEERRRAREAGAFGSASKRLRQSIGEERTFGCLQSRSAMEAQALLNLRSSHSTLLKQGLVCGQVVLKLKHRTFEVHQYSSNIAPPTSDFDTLRQALDTILVPRLGEFHELRLLGIRLSNLSLPEPPDVAGATSGGRDQQATLSQLFSKASAGTTADDPPRSRSPNEGSDTDSDVLLLSLSSTGKEAGQEATRMGKRSRERAVGRAAANSRHGFSTVPQPFPAPSRHNRQQRSVASMLRPGTHARLPSPSTRAREISMQRMQRMDVESLPEDEVIVEDGPQYRTAAKNGSAPEDAEIVILSP